MYIFSLQQERISCYEKEKQRLQLKIPRLLTKRRNEQKKSPDYFVPGVLLNTSNFQELFVTADHEDESDDESSINDDSDSDTRCAI